MNSSAMRHPGALAAPTTRTEGTAHAWATACAPRPREDEPEEPAARLGRLTLPELRELRRVSGREEAELSYVRRILHGRIDILTAEIRGRTASPAPTAEQPPAAQQAPTAEQPPAAAPAPPAPQAPPVPRPAPPAVAGPGDADVVARLADILRDGPPRHRSSVRHLGVVTPDGVEADRLAGTMLQEVALSDLAARTDEELSRGRARLLAYEADVSRRRLALQRTADGCSAEIARRYREGEAQVDDLLL
ncbi:ABC transporter substrate-binding protein [Streptomyces sp. GZWMJZ-114]|uniref:RsiG family protein n=1 Tax=Streptomyces sp. GZWMJZ-114 TaxID=2494734 RepID=UPI001F50BDC9|nr:ABC transporter substrate-binding protein [Streptomyces sp. GZWMJZ-114]